VFERFTDRARRVVVLAQGEARMLSHDYIGTEHLLLGLIHEGDGIAWRALEALGLDLVQVRARVEEMIGHGSRAPTGHIPFTPRAKKVLEFSLRESIDLGVKYIGTEHILLGLLREGEGIAAGVLRDQGVTLAVARQEVVGLLAMTEASVTEAASATETAAAAASGQPVDAPRRGPSWRVERLRPNVRLRRREGDPERTPTCPRCDADLTESVRYRVQDVAAGSVTDDDKPPPRKVAFLYCAECGRVVDANLLDDGR
jgi:ATP-dependent Clp protease ATP-binding subunit ClpA